MYIPTYVGRYIFVTVLDVPRVTYCFTYYSTCLIPSNKRYIDSACIFSVEASQNLRGEVAKVIKNNRCSTAAELVPIAEDKLSDTKWKVMEEWVWLE